MRGRSLAWMLLRILKKEVERSNKFDDQPPQMRLVIRGKIIHVGHVKGYTDATFLTLLLITNT